MGFKGTVKAGLARLSGRVGRQMARLPDGLYVFNCHRVGLRESTQFDPNVFSCTSENLHRHIRELGRYFDFVKPGELDDSVKKRLSGRYALLTFDDGYRDNYVSALPVLQSEGVSAVFFICIDFIDRNEPPWWDRVAFMVRHATVSQVALNGKVIDLSRRPVSDSIREVLRQFKLIEEKSSSKLKLLKEQLLPSIEIPEDRLFMDWSEIADLRRRGMAIGSHTMTHDKLSHLSVDEQRSELAQSKAVLDEKLDQETHFLAYPVGGYDSFTSSTMEIARDLGYRYAFTTEQHPNSYDRLQNLAMGRFSISAEEPGDMQYMMLKNMLEAPKVF